MTREEVKVVFTGIAHDHPMASNAIHAHTHPYQHHYHHHNQNHHNQNHNNHHHQHHQHQLKRNSSQLDDQHSRINHVHQHHEHQHHQYRSGSISNNYPQHSQPLSGCTSDNLPRTQEQPPSSQACAPNKPCPIVQSVTKAGLKEGENATALSTIAILRRHPMYDSLVLVKKYRPCLAGYTLEFPTENEHSNGQLAANGTDKQACENSEMGCGRTKLVSVYLDGDDPIYQSQQANLRQQNGASAHSEGGDGDVVYVPVNGLMNRLENYDRHGVAIDSRVYAFAMGLKTAERFLTSSTVKEMQEAPPL